MFAEENPVMVAPSYILSMSKSCQSALEIYSLPHRSFFLVHCSHTGLLSVGVSGDTSWSRVSKGASREMKSGK